MPLIGRVVYSLQGLNTYGPITIKYFALTGNVGVAPLSMDERDTEGGGWIPEGRSEANIHSMFTCQDVTFVHAFSDLSVCSTVHKISVCRTVIYPSYLV